MSLLLLLVEDDPLIIDILYDALTDAGYEVSKAKNGVEALDAIEANASDLRAVVTDIKLGKGPDGWAIAQRVRELVPTMPVVYMSGDSVHDWASRGVPGSAVLAKLSRPRNL